MRINKIVKTGMMVVAASAATAGTATAQQGEYQGDATRATAGRLQATEKTRKSTGKEKSGTAGINAKDGKQFNEVSTAANAQLQARDFAGAAATYQKGIDANPKSTAAHRLYTGLAIALRQQGTAAFNDGPKPVYPTGTLTNEQIRAANAANAARATQRVAGALPLFQRAQQAAAKAAELGAASQDRETDAVINTELRQDAMILFQLDRDAVVRAPRASADLEATALRAWLAGTPAPGEADAARFGYATAATVVAKDPAAGLTLADEVLARSAGDSDGALDYAFLVVAAKTPAGDPRRAKALAGLTRIEPTLTDKSKQTLAQQYRKALTGA